MIRCCGYTYRAHLWPASFANRPPALLYSATSFLLLYSFSSIAISVRTVQAEYVVSWTVSQINQFTFLRHTPLRNYGACMCFPSLLVYIIINTISSIFAFHHSLIKVELITNYRLILSFRFFFYVILTSFSLIFSIMHLPSLYHILYVLKQLPGLRSSK